MLDCTVGEAIAQPAARALFDDISAEVVAVAQAKGIDLPYEVATAYLEAVGLEARAHVPSMVMDMREGRPTEIACLNGAVVREAAHHGLLVPANNTISRLITARDALSA